MKVKEESEKAGLKLHIQKMKIMASGSIVSWKIEEETMKHLKTLSSWAPKSLCVQSWNLKMFPSWKKSYDKPRQHFKKQRHHLAVKGPDSQSYGFSCSHVRIWELDHKEDWVLKSWCFQTVVLEKTLESPLDCKEIQAVHPKGNQSWVFIGRADAEVPILCPLDVKR